MQTSTLHNHEFLTETALAIAAKLGAPPRIPLAIVTGSGLSQLAEVGVERASVAYGDIPGLGKSGVVGHAGRWSLIDTPGGQPVFVLMGRRHLYEGIETAATALLMRLLARLGVERVLLTNAAGGIVRQLHTGDLMMIVDHINLMFRNPLIGPHDPRMGARFPDMSAPYDRQMQAELRSAAETCGVLLREGVYMALSGPTYETRAEVEVFRRLGGDALGMSTVPETLAARQAGLRVAAISLITNSHVHEQGVTTHEEVIEVGAQAVVKLRKILEQVLPAWT